MQWVRDRVRHLIARRCRIAEAALCPDGSPCAALRRALDRAIVEYLALLRDRTGNERFGTRLDCPPPSPAPRPAEDEPSAEAPFTLGEPWLSAFPGL